MLRNAARAIAPWAALAFVVWMVVSDPVGSAGVVKNVFGFLGHFATSLATFLKSL